MWKTFRLSPFLICRGMYLIYKITEFKRYLQEQNKRETAERELDHLNHKIDKLLVKLEGHEPEMAMSREEECAICISARASMQTFPCGHKVVCRKCFIKTIQIVVTQRILPLRCVVCRARILHIKHILSRGVAEPTAQSVSVLMNYREPHQSVQNTLMADALAGSQCFRSSSINDVTMKSSDIKGVKYKLAISPLSQGSNNNLKEGFSVQESSRSITGPHQSLQTLKTGPERSNIQWGDHSSKNVVRKFAPNYLRRHQVHVSTPTHLCPIKEHEEQETIDVTP
ncbi:uncharacterized protein LOC143235845 [Tachypleus tridentatus]|uniref:uncharacterized protein LOC143235845 n=1 Tax=Tachypleus tridentatus TaxID=6853 RepID=UPI003FD3E964